VKKAASKAKSNRPRKAVSKQRARDMAPKKEIRGGLNFKTKPVDQDVHF
jgi:hypothetical protein